MASSRWKQELAGEWTMDTERSRYQPAILEEAVLAHLFETRALLNVLERKGLVTVGEVSAEIRRLKEQAAKGSVNARTRSGRKD